MSKNPRFKGAVEKYFSVLYPLGEPGGPPGVVVLDRGMKLLIVDEFAHFRQQGIDICYRAPTISHPEEETEHAKAKAKKARS